MTTDAQTGLQTQLRTVYTLAELSLGREDEEGSEGGRKCCTLATIRSSSTGRTKLPGGRSNPPRRAAPPPLVHRCETKAFGKSILDFDRVMVLKGETHLLSCSTTIQGGKLVDRVATQYHSRVKTLNDTRELLSRVPASKQHLQNFAHTELEKPGETTRIVEASI